jgi:large subunit ribosomal protein L15
MIKKVKKAKKMRGSHTHGRGFKKKARGKGHRGGIGKAGSGKRADHKKKLEKGNPYFGKRKVVRKAIKKKLKIISLEKILDNIDSYEKEKNGMHKVELKGYKLIGKVKSLDVKLKISVNEISKGAKESVEKGGGEVVLRNEKKGEVGKEEVK